MARTCHQSTDEPLSLTSTQMMTAQTRPPNKRGPSSAWNRLNQPSVDPLEQYGLPSKGETKLNDFRAQEKYFQKIQERYMKFCGSTGGGVALEQAFSSLSISPTPSSSTTAPTSPPPPLTNPPSTTPHPPTSSPSTTPQQQHDLHLIFHAMRKLRESILTTSRTDTFALKSYIFIIRASLLIQSYESYLPALLYLLHTIHPTTPLSSPELHEFAIYRVLDLACREHNLRAAYEARWRWKVQGDRRLEAVLRALVRDDWHAFWRLRRAVDGYQRRLMDWREEETRLHVLKCLGRAYVQVERRFVERCADAEWEELKRRGVGWGCEGEVVVIRKRKGKG
ncbi:MAG: hypothetical protein M1820_007394 [Bogoriella megaspora]|nr:MAG: hypothetical protein M1820_007394 [Bogoriella megaspora]